MKENDLVIAKNTFSTERTVEFKQGKNYRVCKMDGGFLVYGEWFSKDEFHENFVPLIDVIKEDWEMLGITVGGKLVSKKAFLNLPMSIPMEKELEPTDVLIFINQVI